MKKCNPRVYAKCPERSMCGDFSTAIFVEGSPCDLYNERMLAAPMTNADRIRSMSDEELAGCSLVCPYQIDEYYCTTGKSWQGCERRADHEGVH